VSKIKNVIRGDTHTIDLTFRESGTAIDITGYTLFFTVNASNSPTTDSAAVIEKSVTSHLAPTLGQTRITLAPSDTDSITPGTYYYDIQVKDGSGNITSLPKDKFIIVSDITRRTT
jgi:hypothetical protein